MRGGHVTGVETWAGPSASGRRWGPPVPAGAGGGGDRDEEELERRLGALELSRGGPGPATGQPAPRSAAGTRVRHVRVGDWGQQEGVAVELKTKKVGSKVSLAEVWSQMALSCTPRLVVGWWDGDRGPDGGGSGSLTRVEELSLEEIAGRHGPRALSGSMGRLQALLREICGAATGMEAAAGGPSSFALVWERREAPLALYAVGGEHRVPGLSDEGKEALRRLMREGRV